MVVLAETVHPEHPHSQNPRNPRPVRRFLAAFPARPCYYAVYRGRRCKQTQSICQTPIVKYTAYIDDSYTVSLI